LHIPFAYSPASFFGVAFLGSVAHISTAAAMNVWVCAWAVALVPAIYWSSKSILGSRAGALAATSYAVLAPRGFEYLGMGGGVTRCPGMVFLVLACGALWQLKERWSLSRALIAAACSAACAWTHMEFFALLGLSGLIIVLAQRLSRRRTVTIALMTAALVAPWPIVVAMHGEAGAFVHALGTSHGTTGIDAAIVLLTVFGDFASSAVPAIGVLALLLSLQRGKPLWTLWALVIAVVDSHAASQVEHLVIGLAVGDAVVALERSRTFAPSRSTLAFVAIVCCVLVPTQLPAAASHFVRISQADVSDMDALRAKTPSDAVIVVAYLGERSLLDDQTYEWLPAIANRESATAYEGLEWVDLARYRRTSNSFGYVQGHCGYVGAGCYLEFASKRIARGRPWVLYVPYHSSFSTLLSKSIALDPRFRSIGTTATAAFFAPANP
jgi:hypothetical protein